MKDPKNSNNLQGLQNDVKAYIYQQINEFTPYFLPDSNVAVAVKKKESKSGTKNFVVTMVLTGGGTYVEAAGNDEDLFAATRKAKEDLLKHLESIHKRLVSEHDRDSLIQAIVESQSLH